MRLNDLRDNQGARKSRMRVGRGMSSGKGKTAGRGDKGQKSRSGVSLKGFEGGQMPLHMRLPKRGFNVPNPKKLNAVNLGRLQQALDAGRLDAGETVNAAGLKNAGVIRRELDGVRILGQGELKTKLDFEVSGVSAAARAVIEKLGGKITVLASPEEVAKKDVAPKARKSAVKSSAKAEASAPEEAPKEAPEAAAEAAPVAKDAPPAAGSGTAEFTGGADVTYEQLWKFVDESAGGNLNNVRVVPLDNVDLESDRPVPFGYGGKPGGMRRTVQDWLLKGVEGDRSLAAVLDAAAPLGHSRKKPVCLMAMLQGGYSPSSATWGQPFVKLVVQPQTDQEQDK